MKKAIHFILVGICILAASAVMSLWSRTYSRSDRLHWVSWSVQGNEISALMSGFDLGMGSLQYVRERTISSSDPGEIQTMRDMANRFQPNGRPFRSTRPPRTLIRENSESILTALGFEMDVRQYGGDDIREHYMEIALPFWFIFAITLAYPVTSYIRGVLRRHRAERLSVNLCPRCGEPLAARATHCACCDRPVVVVAEA